MNQQETETQFDLNVRPEDFGKFMSLMIKYLEEEVTSKMGLINDLNKIKAHAESTHL